MKAWLGSLALAFLPLAARAQEPLPRNPANLSVRNEVQLAIDKANGWLAKEQHPDGSWSDPEQPALTALPLLAIFGNPQRPDRPREALDSVRRALEAIRRHAHPDGSICGREAPLLNTAISLAALQRATLPEDDARVAAARAYLVSHQQANGGFGDLVTTAWVLDTLHDAGALPDKTADGARRYVKACERPNGDGYSLTPGGSASHPSASSAAYLALALTGAPTAALMTLAPGGDTQQLYLLTKALGLSPPVQGRPVPFALLLINTQTSAGTWRSPLADPVEVTSYGVLTLELLYRGL